MTCVICGAELNEGTVYIGEDDGQRYCNDCYYDQHCECQDCGEWHLRDNMNYSTNHECYYCDDCYGEERDNMTIREYHDRDIPITFKSLENEETKLYYGFELEVEATYDAKLDCDDMATHIRETYPDLDLCFEYDSSLNRGFEIISQPMTINYINEHKEDFKNMLNDLQENDYTSHNSGHCGLHIHVSRNAFGENDKEQEKNINKLLLFTETYKKELQSFSRRRDYGYCNFLSNNSNTLSNDRYFKSTKILGEENKNKGRYQVVNTLNSNTIELRVFRGTLRYETFIATLTFVDNLMNTILTKSISKISWDKVINYNAIPELVEYVESKNLFNCTPMVDETKNVEKEYKKKLAILEVNNEKFMNAMKEIIVKVQDYCDTLKFDIKTFEKGEEFNKLSTNMKLYSNLINKLNNNMYLLNCDLLDKNNYIKVLCKNMNEYNNTLTSFINELLYCFDYTDNKNDSIVSELREYKDCCAYTETTITEI